MLANLFPAVVQHKTMTMDEHHVDVKKGRKNALNYASNVGFLNFRARNDFNCSSFNLVLPDIKGDNI